MSTQEPTPTQQPKPGQQPTEPLAVPRLEQIPLTPPLEPTVFPGQWGTQYTQGMEPGEDGARTEPPQARIGTVVWGLIVLALAALIIISKLGIVALNGTYVLIGLMLGAGAALVIGGLLSARSRSSARSGNNTAGTAGIK